MNELKRCKPLLGTYVEIAIRGELDDAALMDLSTRAFAEIELVHQLMSFHDPSSEISVLNGNAHERQCHVSQHTEEVLRQALSISQATDGVFDVTVGARLVARGTLPDLGHSQVRDGSWTDIHLHDGYVTFDRPLRIDVGGIAKGYAVDCAISVLDGKAQATVNAGGDLRMTDWQGQDIAVRHPSPAHQGEFIHLPMEAPAAATSATTFSTASPAILSPHDGAAMPDHTSVTVFAPSCMLADALTKVVALDPACGPILESFGASAQVLEFEGAAS